MRGPEQLGPYTLCQPEGVFPLGEDALALGGFATVKRGWRVCDLGTGSGCLLLLLAGREEELWLSGVDRDPAARAAEGDGLCLLELQDPKAALERADRLVLYRWGRHYPADRRLDLPPEGWRLEGQTEFPGRSHDMITKEIYVK